MANLRLGRCGESPRRPELPDRDGHGRCRGVLVSGHRQGSARPEERGLEDLARFQRSYMPDHSKLCRGGDRRARSWGKGSRRRSRPWTAAIAKHPEDPELRYAAARAFAAASKADGRARSGEGASARRPGPPIAEEAVRDDDADFGRMDDDPAFDPIRDDPAFVAIMKDGHPDRRYAAVWSSEASVEISRSRARARRAPRACPGARRGGYRPVALSVAPTMPEGPLVATSVWHRPVVSEQDKDRLAERQARAAVALIRLGKAEGLAPLAAQPRSPAPQLHRQLAEATGSRSARVIADRIRRASTRARRSRARPRSARDDGRHPLRSRDVDATGADPGPRTLRRRAASPGRAEPLDRRSCSNSTANDPDAGIHGAAEWTLRRWKQQEKLGPSMPI